MKNNIFALTLILLFTLCPEAHALDVIMSIQPPFNYLDENKQPTGFAVEIVKATCEEAGLKPNFIPMPWARAYQTAKETRNTLLISMLYSEKRKPFFRWIGPIGQFKTHFYALGNKHKTKKFRSLAELKPYTIIVRRNDARHEYLKKHGFKLFVVDSYVHTLRLLKDGRADFWATATTVAEHVVRESISIREPLRVVFTPEKMTSRGYMVFNAASDPALVQRMRDAFERIKQQGILDRITKEAVKLSMVQ